MSLRIQMKVIGEHSRYYLILSNTIPLFAYVRCLSSLIESVALVAGTG